MTGCLFTQRAKNGGNTTSLYVENYIPPVQSHFLDVLNLQYKIATNIQLENARCYKNRVHSCKQER
jgi:hypothetical protein